MKENYFFHTIKGEIERKKAEPTPDPLLAREGSEQAEPAMTARDYWRSLRQTIQDNLSDEETIEPADPEKIKLLSELVSPELIASYNQILSKFRLKSGVSREHPKRELIDVGDSELAKDIEAWIGDLVSHVHDKKGDIFYSENIEDLRAQCWLYFDSMSNVMNTNAMEQDVTSFFTEKAEDDEAGGFDRQKEELTLDLVARYHIDRTGAGILIEIMRNKDKDYSFQLLVETISRLWDQYGLGERKTDIAKISLGYLLSRAASSFAPSLFAQMLPLDKFSFPVFVEFLCLQKLSSFIDIKTRIDLSSIINDISHQINERITDSIFFQEFEFVHEKSLGEIYSALSQGKSAIRELLRGVISRFTPALAGIVMSLAFLMKIHPLLAVTNFVSLPVMYHLSRKKNSEVSPIYNKEREQFEQISTRLSSVKKGLEEIRTSPELPEFAGDVKRQLDERDDLGRRRFILESEMNIRRNIPQDVASLISGAVGWALQREGLVSGGAVFSSIMYSDRLLQPINSLVEMYFDDFARNIQDIQRMEEILGRYDALDLPEGEKEKERKSASELKGYDISVEGVKFKHILRDVSLEIKHGEFVTITGASGAGKSTLLKNIVGLYHPEAGEIKIGDVPADQIKRYGDDSLYSIMSYCNQSPQIFEGMTLRENLMLWSRKIIPEERLEMILRDLHLDKFIRRLDEEVKNLSGGEKVRMGVARTLIKGAKILLLDEPTASLDSEAGAEVRRIIQDLRVKYPETTIVCVSHDPELSKISDRSINLTELQVSV